MVGERDEIVVAGFAWDYYPGRNVEHLAGHDVFVADVNAVLVNGALFFRNLPGRGATHLMIGRDDKGRSLLVALVQTPEQGVWYPVTAWRSQIAHQILEKEG